MSIGTMSRFDLSYLKGVPPEWVHMICPIDFYGNGYFTPHPTTIIKGKFVDQKKLYGAA